MSTRNPSRRRRSIKIYWESRNKGICVRNGCEKKAAINEQGKLIALCKRHRERRKQEYSRSNKYKANRLKPNFQEPTEKSHW